MKQKYSCYYSVTTKKVMYVVSINLIKIIFSHLLSFTDMSKRGKAEEIPLPGADPGFQVRGRN